MIRGAIDESGTHANARALCVAACVGTSTQWGKLRARWNAEVVRELGGLGQYHAKLAKCAALNDLLAELIVAHMDYGIVAVIREPDFKQHVPHEVRSFFGSAYEIGVGACLSYVSLHYRKQKEVAYVIEAGHKNQPAVRAYLTACSCAPGARRITECAPSSGWARRSR